MGKDVVSKSTDSSSMQVRVIILGFDGATYRVMDPLMKQGKMPNLAHVIANGVRSVLESTIPPDSAPAWTSFMTGKNPGKHGIFSFRNPNPDTYSEIGPIVSSGDIQAVTLWDLLSDAGKTVGVINVPVTYPVRKVNGFMISGFLTPPGARNYTYPLEIKESLGDYQIEALQELLFPWGKRSLGERLRIRDYELILKEAATVTWKRARVAIQLLDDWSCDLFVVLFRNTDLIQHYFWHIMDPDDPRHDPEMAERLRGALVNYFKIIDEIIGQFLRRMDANTVLIVMSDHGFGPAPLKKWHVNYWLEQIGLLRFKKRSWLFVLLKRVARYVEKYSRQLGIDIWKRAKTISKKTENVISSIDWSKTIAYGIKIGTYAYGININTQKNKPAGIVADHEYERIRDLIIRELKLLRDPETNQRIVASALRREAVYVGEYANRAPDIIVLPNPLYITERTMILGDIPTSLLTSHSSSITGRHRRDGIFIAIGKDIKRGQTVPQIRMIDLAPTILHMLGVPIPSDMDGSVFKEMFRDGSILAEKTAQYQDVDEEKNEISKRAKKLKAPRGKYGKEEEKKVKERLRALGYL